jgi:hypothetical protein
VSITARTPTYSESSSQVAPYDVTVNAPSGVTDGDLMFTFIMNYGYIIDSVPSGWNSLLSATPGTDHYYLYWKWASSEPASYTWSFSASARVHIVCVAYYCSAGEFDSSKASPFDVTSSSNYRTNDTILRAASMTTTRSGDPLFFFGGVYSTSGKTLTKPSIPTSDWVADYNRGSAATSRFYGIICSMIWTSYGSTTNMDATISSNVGTKHAFAVSYKSDYLIVSENLRLLSVCNKSMPILRLISDSVALLSVVCRRSVFNRVINNFLRLYTDILSKKTTPPIVKIIDNITVLYDSYIKSFRLSRIITTNESIIDAPLRLKAMVMSVIDNVIVLYTSFKVFTIVIKVNEFLSVTTSSFVSRIKRLIVTDNIFLFE